MFAQEPTFLLSNKMLQKLLKQRANMQNKQKKKQKTVGRNVSAKLRQLLESLRHGASVAQAYAAQAKIHLHTVQTQQSTMLNKVQLMQATKLLQQKNMF